MCLAHGFGPWVDPDLSQWLLNMINLVPVWFSLQKLAVALRFTAKIIYNSVSPLSNIQFLLSELQ